MRIYHRTYYSGCVLWPSVVKIRETEIAEYILHHKTSNGGHVYEYHYTTIHHSITGAKLSRVRMGAKMWIWNIVWYLLFQLRVYKIDSSVLLSSWSTTHSKILYLVTTNIQYVSRITPAARGLSCFPIVPYHRFTHTSMLPSLTPYNHITALCQWTNPQENSGEYITLMHSETGNTTKTLQSTTKYVGSDYGLFPDRLFLEIWSLYWNGTLTLSKYVVLIAV